MLHLHVYLFLIYTSVSVIQLSHIILNKLVLIATSKKPIAMQSYNSRIP